MAKEKKQKGKYLHFACDLETSSEYHIDNKPSAAFQKKEYLIWNKKKENCKAWIYLYCALNNDKYLLAVNFVDWLNKIVRYAKIRAKTNLLKCFFHNLKYDGSFLLYELYKLNYQFTNPKLLLKDKKLASALIDEHKNIYCIKFWYQDYFFYLQCSYNLMRCGIAEILSLNGKKPLKISYETNILYLNLQEVPKDVIAYIKQDCDAIITILLIIRIIKKQSYKVRCHLSVGGWGKDAAYFAFYESLWYRTNKNLMKKYLWNYKKDNTLFLQFRESYHGGLTGLNKNFYNSSEGAEIIGNIKTYDINSAYPYIMSQKIPYGKPQKKLNKYEYLIEIYINNILKVNVFEKFWLVNKFKYENQRIFLIWNFEWELIKKLINFDYYVIKKWYFDYAPFYKPFINKMNALKENYTKLLNDAKNERERQKYQLLRRTIKLLMNSPYGKEAQKEYQNIEINKKYQWILKNDSEIKLKFTNIAGASFITAKVRSMILKILSLYPENILYWDTDCVHVLFNNNLEQKEFETIINVNETILGNWKLEYEACKAKYIKKKCYALMDNQGNIKWRTAGYDFENFNWNDFFKGNQLADISLYSFRNKWEQIILSKISKKL